MKNNYESMVIFNTKLSDAQISDENTKLLNFLKENGAEITESQDRGIRRLAYKIKKLDQGYYFVNYFTVETSVIKKLENYYMLNQDSIIRFNIIKK